MQQNTYSRADWLRIHDDTARDYRKGEWTREVLFGIGKKRSRQFAQASGNVLDVGCGYGANFPHLVNAERITGVDFSPRMLDLARQFTHDLRDSTRP